MATIQSDKTRPFRVLWAVDPFASDYIAQTTALQALHSLTDGIKTDVTPVYLHGAHLYKDVEGVSKDEIDKLRASAQKFLDRINDATTKTREIRFRPLVIIAEPFLRRGRAINELIHYAKDIRVDCILLNTHARKGVGRLLLGSFAEELTLKSDVPVLTANPYCDVASPRQIIFTTDFSDESETAFKQVLKFARVGGMPIKLFHQARYPLIPVMEYGFSPYPAYQQVAKEEVAQNRAKAEKWMQTARDFGIPISSFFDEKEKTPADGILEFSENNPGILALTARSGKFERILLGSTTRRVLREACYPVWIVHPEAKEVRALNKNYKTASSYAFWQGGLKSGFGTFSASSGPVCDIPFTYAGRFEKEDQPTPESLLGTAEAACVAMSLASELEKKNITSSRIDVSSTVYLENIQNTWRIQGIDIDAIVCTRAGNRIPIEDAFDRALESSLISNVLTVPINSKLDVRSPDQMVENETKSA